MSGNTRYIRFEALAFLLHPQPGKLDIQATLPMGTQRDLSLADSPEWRRPAPT